MSQLNRRHFLAITAASAVSTSLTAAETKRVRGANERVVLALLGAGGRGTSVAGGFASREDTEIAVVCDLHEGRSAKVAEKFAGILGAVSRDREGLRLRAGTRRHRRRHRRHARSLAWAGDDSRVPGGQGCLRRETAVA